MKLYLIAVTIKEKGNIYSNHYLNFWQHRRPHATPNLCLFIQKRGCYWLMTLAIPMICLEASGARGIIQICILTSPKNILPHESDCFELHTSYCSLFFRCISIFFPRLVTCTVVFAVHCLSNTCIFCFKF